MSEQFVHCSLMFFHWSQLDLKFHFLILRRSFTEPVEVDPDVLVVEGLEQIPLLAEEQIAYFNYSKGTQ